MDRRNFMTKAGLATAGAMLSPAFVKAITADKKKTKLVLVGTGARGHGFWGKKLVDSYGDYVEFEGICDINPGRVKFAKDYMGVTCPTFTSFDEMLEKTDPDLAIVCTVDSTHDEFVIKSLEYGIDVITEKPMVTDEHKCQAIIEAERKSGEKVIVGFNYRWAPYMTKIKELLVNNNISGSSFLRQDIIHHLRLLLNHMDPNLLSSLNLSTMNQSYNFENTNPL